MDRFLCNKNPKSICLRCGGCCSIRELDSYSETEDYDIRRKLYEEFGYIYIYPLNRLTINLNKSEVKKLKQEALKINILLDILPKKIVFENNKLKVLDWFLDHNVCPFFDKELGCKIYEQRPKICKEFPFKVDKKHKNYSCDLNFDSAINSAEFMVRKIEKKNKKITFS